MGDALIAKLQAYGGRLTDTQIASLRKITRIRTLAKAGSDIIKEGDSPRDVHLVYSGIACRYKMLENGRRQIVAFVLPGDFCDLPSSVIKPMDHGISALSDVCFVNFDPLDIDAMLSQPEIAQAVQKSNLVEKAVLREWIANNGQRQAHLRVAHLLCEVYTRLSIVEVVKNRILDLSMSQQDLADATGMSSVHLNRSLSRLKEQALINVVGVRSKIEILDFERLMTISGFRAAYLHLDEVPTLEAA